MAQGYYTLQEAAQYLSMGPDELKQMAQKKEIRSFQDRGTLRFRIQDVQELARRRGANSDPDLILGPPVGPATPRVGPKSGAKGGPKSGPKSGPKAGPRLEPGPRTPTKQQTVSAEVFNFSLDVDDKVDIGEEILVDLPGGSKKSGASAPGSSPGQRKPQRSPTPKPNSDSDVRLVSARDHAGSSSDVMLVGQDSDVHIPEISTKTPKVIRQAGSSFPSPRPSKSPVPSVQPDSAPQKRPSRLAGAAQPADSGVRLVPIDSDSDVKIVGAGSDEVSLGESPPTSASDSDIRLEKYNQPASGSGEGAMLLTEEINLDEEIRKQETALKEAAQDQPPTKLKPKSKLQFPTTSPFELSESDIGSSSAPPKSGAKPKSKPPSEPDDSSDFNLAPAEESATVMNKPSSSDDFSLELPDDSALGAEMSALSGPTSGISLDNPVDAGISLEEGNPEASDIDFDLSLEVEATPRPTAGHKAALDSDSEFELSLDADDSSQPPSPTTGDSDSEFELTLDDSGGLSPLDSDAAAPQIKSDSEERDIFETDFEVPALEDESGSQVASLDTDLDSSDFDIALDDSGVEEESQSQVVALDEEADEAATTRATEDEGIEVEVESEGEFGDLAEEEGEVVEAGEDVDDAKTVVREKIVQAAPWGPLPVVFMLPCVLVMVLVGLLGFELVQSAAGYKTPGFLTKTIGEMIGQKIK